MGVCIKTDALYMHVPQISPAPYLSVNLCIRQPLLSDTPHMQRTGSVLIGLAYDVRTILADKVEA